jgi:3-phenylpropionate/trans-cinnamate dioxygenase ferredoxin reductase subunit
MPVSLVVAIESSPTPLFRVLGEDVGAVVAGIHRDHGDAIHWFWSDQYVANLQYAGFHHEWERLVVRGSLERRSFIAFYLNRGRIDAVVALNRGKDVRRAMPLIRSREFVDPERLKHEDVDLRSLAPVPTSGGQ